MITSASSWPQLTNLTSIIAAFEAADLPSAASYISSTSLSAEVLSSEPFTLYSSLNSVLLSQNVSAIQLSSLAEGNYNLVVGGQDSARNSASPIAHGFSLDLAALFAQISADIESGSTNSTSNQFVLSANEAGQFECDLNDAGFSLCSSPMPVSGLAERDHLFCMRAIHLAGNVGQLVSVSWHVDLTAPLATMDSINRISNASIEFGFSSEAGAAFECSMNNGAYVVCTSLVRYSSLAVRNYSFKVRARAH